MNMEAYLTYAKATNISWYIVLCVFSYDWFIDVMLIKRKIGFMITRLFPHAVHWFDYVTLLLSSHWSPRFHPGLSCSFI